MCSLTWIQGRSGFELFFNRDEQRTRAAGEMPARHSRGGVSWLAPRDPQGGGTWISVNARGLALALMNGANEPRPAVAHSRGLLVDTLADAGTPDEVRARLERQDFSRFAPHSLIVFAPGLPPHRSRWDGRERRWRALDETDLPLCSSSLDPVGAQSARSVEFARLARLHAGQPEQMLSCFHASHAPERGPLSACMHREDACTVSFTRVRVGRERIEMGYLPCAPCERSELRWSQLPRTDAEVATPSF